MSSSLKKIAAQLPAVYKKSQFNQKDLLVVIQGVTGFFGGAIGQDPFGALGNAINVAGHFATKCNSGSLQDNLGKTKKWLAFGKEYAALKDSSDLDFDKMDIGSVPEVMKVVTHFDQFLYILVKVVIVLGTTIHVLDGGNYKDLSKLILILYI